MSVSMQDWIGYKVSLECGPTLGKIDGVVVGVNPEKQTISLASVYQNGSSSKLPSLTINAKDIRDLKILKVPDKISNSNTNTNANVDNLVCQGGRVVSNENADHNNANKGNRKTNTPRKNSDRRYKNDKDEVCFGTPVDSNVLDQEFDFEKNLALFDKKAIFNEIENMNPSNRSEVLEDGQSNFRTGKYKCDENVLESKPVALRQIAVPVRVVKEYVTDSGLIIPSIPLSLRQKISDIAVHYGLNKIRQIEMLGRAASEMLLQVLGGSHRFMPKNMHQIPKVTVLCGSEEERKIIALNCARHLANHSVQVVVFSNEQFRNTPISEELSKELSLYKMTTGKRISGVSALKDVTADIVVSTWGNSHDVEGLKDWISKTKAPVCSIDPDCKTEVIQSKWSIVPILPLAYSNNSSRIYLCDLGIPSDIFSQVGIDYQSPFGHKFVIPLHSKD